jgi:hypothetical protein
MIFCNLLKSLNFNAVRRTCETNNSFQDSCTAHLLARKLARALRILEKVIDQTERRVFRDAKVPASSLKNPLCKLKLACLRPHYLAISNSLFLV